eukprot:1517914-Ditylum_brightwellii.AAC.1
MSSPQTRVKQKGQQLRAWKIGNALGYEPMVHVLNAMPIYRQEGGLNASILVRRYGVFVLTRRHEVFPSSNAIICFLQ